MPLRSPSFDDPDDSDLYVFSGYDLLVAHYDVTDLDWREVAERSSIDERRGLVVAQVAHLEELIDEFLLYLFDPADPEDYQQSLDNLTIGPRIDRWSKVWPTTRCSTTGLENALPTYARWSPGETSSPMERFAADSRGSSRSRISARKILKLSGYWKIVAAAGRSGCRWRDFETISLTRRTHSFAC